MALKLKIASLKESKVKSLLTNLQQISSQLETNLTCYLCMDMMKKPLTCIPCGHNFCSGCHKDHRLTQCPKCDKQIKGTIDDQMLGDIVTNYVV